MKWFRSIALVYTALMLLFSGCTTEKTPPNISKVEQKFRDHYADIEVIVDFMIDSGYKNIYIDDTSGEMLADLERVKISNQAAIAALSRLLKSSAYKSVSKRGNTVSFLQWASVHEISCGIAYSINGTDSPELQFVTELHPISIENWYYYIEDYNKWRTSVEPSI